jgi:hypothetical protein
MRPRRRCPVRTWKAGDGVEAGIPVDLRVVGGIKAHDVEQPDARWVIAKTVGTNLAYMARRHKTVVKTGGRDAAR